MPKFFKKKSSQPLPTISFPDGVVTLRDCRDASVDVCFVHGLTGNRDSTWTAHGQSKPWPETLLPPKLVKARILTYGYDAYIVRKSVAGSNRLIDHSTNLLNDLTTDRVNNNASSRPIIFVAHSLGGLVCKEALLLSRNNPEAHLKNIFNCTKGIIFMGTPHTGSWMADWAKMPASALGIVKSTNISLLKILETDDQFLESIQVGFLAMIRDLREKNRRLEVTCFFEELPLPVVGRVVPKDSATFAGYNPISIHADHRNMVKFASADENGFQRLLGELVRWEAEVSNATTDDQTLATMTEEESECMTSLGPSTYVQDKDFNPVRIEGTCQWFLHHRHFTAWHERNASGLLWVSGDPGCGKSVLSKYLVDEILRETDVQSTCFYFFKDLPGRNDATTALRAILHQLFDHQPALLKYAMKDFKRSKTGFIQTFDTYWEILLEATKSAEARSVVCILDALDECQESGLNIVRKLNNLYRGGAKSSISNPVVKFLVTSRPYYNIERKFLELTRTMPTIRLAGEEDPNAINREINLVIDFRVGNMPWEEKTKSLLREALRAPLNRTYLWVVLVFEVLENALKVTQRNAESIVNNLPQNVGEAYEAMLNKSPNKPLARRLLYIVLCAERPLTLAEMNVALNTTNDCKTLSDVDRQETNELLKVEIRNLCQLFVSVVDSKIYLIHQTAKEFLLSKHEDTPGHSLPCDLKWKSTFLLQDGNKILAEACISYLLFSEFERALQSAESEYVFLDYSAKFWALHFREAKVGDYKLRVAESALALCDISSKRCQLWYKTWVTSIRFAPGLHSSLTLAAYFGHTTTVEQLLLDEAANLDSKDTRGRTPLSYAASNGREAVVKLLLEKGAELEAKDTSGDSQTPLSYAAEYGHEAVVKLLLEKGAELEAKDTRGRTPLSYAASNGREAVVKLLLEKGAELEAKDTRGRTPLSYAAEYSHEAVVKLLLEKGAELEAKDTRGQTPLLWAAWNGRDAVVKLLLEKGAKLEAKDTRGRTPLSYAAEYSHEAVVKLLLEKGAKLEAKDTRGRTPLSYAAEYGHEAVVKLLLEKGAVLEAKDSSGRTPLLWAAWNGRDAVVKLLLEKGAELEAKDTRGQTPLLWAAENGHEAVVKLLLEKGAELEAKDTSGRTPLSQAAENGHEAVVKLLLEKGAELEAKDTSGDSQTPLSYAAAYGREAVVKLLLEKGAKLEAKDSSGRTPLLLATAYGRDAVVKLLLEKGAELEAKDTSGQTPLSYAAANGRDAVVKLLLEKGAKLEAKDTSGRTPLLWAAAYGRKAVVKLLLEKGAKLEAKDTSGQTPLSYAAENGRDAVVKLLLEKGAKLEAKDTRGQTPLLWAAWNGHEAVVKLLLEKGAKNYNNP